MLKFEIEVIRWWTIITIITYINQVTTNRSSKKKTNRLSSVASKLGENYLQLYQGFTVFPKEFVKLIISLNFQILDKIFQFFLIFNSANG